MVYLIHKNGKLTIEQDFHSICLFSIQVWRELLKKTGFEIHEEKYSESNNDYVQFACIKPL